MRDEDVLLEKAMAALRDAEPSPGFERRILATIEAHQLRRANWWWPVFALACALIAGLFVHYFPPIPARMTIAATQPPGPEKLSVTRVVERTRQRRQRHHPAPPLPLTDQEKLLLRLAHRPDDATILNPVNREAQSARATTEFQYFFQMDEAEMRSQLE
jgi:hypothetical protein